MHNSCQENFFILLSSIYEELFDTFSNPIPCLESPPSRSILSISTDPSLDNATPQSIVKVPLLSLPSHQHLSFRLH